MDVAEFQTAYQKGKGCNTRIFTLRTIIELAKRRRKAIYIAFFDLEKAFHRVRRITMLKTLIDAGIGSTLANAVKQLYASISVFYNNVDQFETTTGIRQGTSSSAYIYIIFMNNLFKHPRDSFQPNIIFGNIHNLIHADDTIILDKEITTFREIIITTHSFFVETHQKLNFVKIKYMCIDTNNLHKKEDIDILNTTMEYSTKEK